MEYVEKNVGIGYRYYKKLLHCRTTNIYHCSYIDYFVATLINFQFISKGKAMKLYTNVLNQFVTDEVAKIETTAICPICNSEQSIFLRFHLRVKTPANMLVISDSNCGNCGVRFQGTINFETGSRNITTI